VSSIPKLLIYLLTALNHELILKGSRSFPSPVYMNGVGHFGLLDDSGGGTMSDSASELLSLSSGSSDFGSGLGSRGSGSSGFLSGLGSRCSCSSSSSDSDSELELDDSGSSGFALITGFSGVLEASGKCPGISGFLDADASDSWYSRDIWRAGSDSWITGAAGALDALIKRPLLSLGGAMVYVSGRAGPDKGLLLEACVWVSGCYR